MNGINYELFAAEWLFPEGQLTKAISQGLFLAILKFHL